MTNEEMIRQMYEGNLNAQKTQLQADYEAAATDLDVQRQQNQQTADANLNRTAVEAQKRAMNDAEYYAASGLTSGAKAQARMARDNQLASDLSAIRAAQQVADADIERQRGLLAKEYDSAIRKAQADNDIALAEALYKQAQLDEERLLTQQQNAAKLIAEEAGDFSRIGQLYGLTAEEIALLNALKGVNLNPKDPIVAPPGGEEPIILDGERSVVVQSPAPGKKPVIVGATGAKGANAGTGRTNALLNFTELRGLR